MQAHKYCSPPAHPHEIYSPPLIEAETGGTDLRLSVWQTQPLTTLVDHHSVYRLHVSDIHVSGV